MLVPAKNMFYVQIEHALCSDRTCSVFRYPSTGTEHICFIEKIKGERERRGVGRERAGAWVGGEGWRESERERARARASDRD